MKKTLSNKFLHIEQMNRMLKKPGLLLVSRGKDGKPNVMTIGWALIGILWERPVLMVAVRPSRHTHHLIEYSGDFTVNVPSDGMDDICEFCGEVSGKDRDKLREKGLTVKSSRKIRSPIIEQCVLHYECRTLYKSKVNFRQLPPRILGNFYPKGDYHTLYFGEVLAVYGKEQ